MGIAHRGERVNLEEVTSKYTLDAATLQIKKERDTSLASIIRGENQRLLLVMGPCSADNEEAVLTYAHKLAALQKDVSDKIFIVMRVYTAKPRTNGDGYKGILHESQTTVTEKMVAVRRIHYRVISETGLTTADELLYPSHLSLVNDLVSYHAVGARSVENQEHRFIASALDAPVGLKNPTSGQLRVMFNAIYAAQQTQYLIEGGRSVETTGNPLAHAVLRGGTSSDGTSVPNYHYEDLIETIDSYEEMRLQNPFILIDTNHDNSRKQYLEQVRIVRETLMNRLYNEKIARHVRGFMIESYLEDGRQDEPDVFGKSITDACLGWDKTEQLVRMIYDHLTDITEKKEVE